MKIHVYSNKNELFENFSEVFISEVNKGLCIIPGGNTPKEIYNLVSNKSNLIKNRSVLLSDDRLVEKSDKFSNFNMINNYFKIDFQEGYPIDYYIFFSQNKIKELQNKISELISVNNLYCSFLGIGSDSHTASLFPHNKKNLSDDVSGFVLKNNFETYKRFTLSYKTIFSAEKIIFIINGKKKHIALKNILSKNINYLKYPAQRFIKEHNHVEIYCDSIYLII